MRTRKNKCVFKKKDLSSGDGMLTTVWGPSFWHVLHTMSFNYPVNPTKEDKVNYKAFILNLQNVLPCKYCRQNLTKNFKIVPLLAKHLESRDAFSRYVYALHECVNKMLKKTSNLSYCDVRERYEHFRARCTTDTIKVKPSTEKGCTEPLYKGHKAKGIIQIIPDEVKCKSISIDPSCLKTIV
jgi:hypothetical protein